MSVRIGQRHVDTDEPCIWSGRVVHEVEANSDADK